jgi:hypothetical protein
LFQQAEKNMLRYIIVFIGVFFVHLDLHAQEYYHYQSKEPSFPENDDQFGFSVDISTGFAIIGAPKHRYKQSNLDPKLGAGAAFIYKKDFHAVNNWKMIKKISASDRGNLDFFATDVAISNSHALVGAPLQDYDQSGGNPLNNSGSAYLFKRNVNTWDDWLEIKKIVAPDRRSFDEFGSKVAMDGEYLLVSAPKNCFDGSGADSLNKAGAVYVYKKDEGGADNWGFLKKITAPDRQTEDQFGHALAIYGDILLVSSVKNNGDTNGLHPLTHSGAVYVFGKNKGGSDHWGFIRKIISPERIAQGAFGSSLDIHENLIVVGASQENDHKGSQTIPNAGKAYVYEIQNENVVLLRILRKSNPLSQSFFGHSVSIYGQDIMVGAYGEQYDSNEQKQMLFAGAVYHFKSYQNGWGSWGLVSKITPPDRSARTYFAYDLALSNTFALIGTYAKLIKDSTQADVYAGEASIYKRYRTIFNPVLDICQGDSLYLQGAFRKDPGLYYDTGFSTVYGTDSFTLSELRVHPDYLLYPTYQICSGDSLLLQGAYRKSAGIYTDTFSGYYHCDSIHISQLIVHPSYEFFTYKNVCQGDSVMIYDQYRKSSGKYKQEFQTWTNCDSIYSTVLHVRPLPDKAILVFEDSVLKCFQNALYYEWYLDDKVIDGSSDMRMYKPYKNGTYTLKTYNIYACSNWSDPFVFYKTFIRPGLHKTKIFPNPVYDILYVEMDSAEEYEINIYDLQGKLLLHKKISRAHSEIYTGGLKPGLYLLDIRGNKTYSRHLLLKKQA